MKIVVFFSILLLPVLLFPYFYRVKSINCQNQYGECSAEIQRSLSTYQNSSIKKTLRNLDDYLAENSRVSSYKIIYRPIADIDIEIIEEKADVAIKEKTAEEFKLISQAYKLIAVAIETNLPKLYITNENIKYDSIESKFAQELLVELAKYYDIREAQLDESSIVTTYKDELQLTFPVSGDIDVLLGSLELLVFQLKQRLPDTKITSIDLRYKNPVVK